MLLLFCSFLVWRVQPRFTHGAANCHGGHFDHCLNFGANLGGTCGRSHSYMAKVEGRTKYTLIILSCSDSILRALWGGSTPFFAFCFLVWLFYSDDWFKKYSFTNVIIGLFRCAETQSISSSISPIKVDIFQTISLLKELNRLAIKHLGQLSCEVIWYLTSGSIGVMLRFDTFSISVIWSSIYWASSVIAGTCTRMEMLRFI